MSPITISTLASNSWVRNDLPSFDFCDAYQIPLRDASMTAEQIYCAVMLDVPKWAQVLMRWRNALVGLAGLKQGDIGDAEQLAAQKLHVGQRLGVFVVLALLPDEVVVGDDDAHLNFRVSTAKSMRDGVAYITVSTAVRTHNALGRAYIFVVKPFHKMIVRSMLNNALKKQQV